MNPVARCSALALFAAAGLPAAAQTITAVATAGDPVIGVGNVTSINALAVNNNGQWMVEADTDNTDTNADEVMLRSGTLLLREGQSLTGLAVGTLDFFDSVHLNSAGNAAWNLGIAGSGGLSTDSGMFFNGTLIFQESTVSTAAGFSAGTPYIGFFESRLNDSNQVFIVASIDDPAIASTVDRALVVLNYNPGAGTYTESVLVKEGDLLSGMSLPVADFGTGPHSSDFNNAGQAMFIVQTTSLGGINDAVYINSTQLAMETLPSPTAGRTWTSLGSSNCSIDSTGANYVYTGTLSGDPNTASIIIRNGAKFMQEGDAPPGIPGGFTLTAFGTSSIVHIGDNGKVCWFGDWNDPATMQDTALFLDNQVLLQEGVTQVGGLTVQAIVNATDGFNMSENGRYIIAEVTLTDGVTPRAAALLIDMGAPPTCYANCDGIGGLTANDFTCFLTAYTTGQSYANCDGVGGLTANDFACFLNAYTNGCS